MGFSGAGVIPGEPTIDLRITGPTTFELLDSFTYTDDHDPTTPSVTVDKGLETDLASVPFFLQWVVRSYGKHTRAALVHDWLWRLDELDPPSQIDRLRLANRLFRDGMMDGDVAIVRRWIMWSAVSLAMLVRLGPLKWLRLAVWGLAGVTLLGAIVAATGWTFGWRTPVIAAIALGATTVVAATVRAVAKAKGSTVLCDVAGQTATIAGAYTALTLALTAVSQADVVRDHWALVALGAFVVCGAAMLADWKAGLIGVAGVAVVAIPVTASFAALAIYGVIELAVYFIRSAKNDEVTPPATPAMVRHGG